jgi:hypothetical protein
MLQVTYDLLQINQVIVKLDRPGYRFRTFTINRDFCRGEQQFAPTCSPCVGIVFISQSLCKVWLMQKPSETYRMSDLAKRLTFMKIHPICHSERAERSSASRGISKNTLKNVPILVNQHSIQREIVIRMMTISPKRNQRFLPSQAFLLQTEDLHVRNDRLGGL